MSSTSAAINEKRELLLAEIASLKDRQQKDKEKLFEYQKKNKLLYFGRPGYGFLGDHGVWEPNPSQKRIFKAIRDPSYSIFSMTGANQQGKTLAEICVILCCIRGCWPWEDPNIEGRWLWELRGWKPPIDVRWIGNHWEEHIQKNLITQGLERLLPDSWNWKQKRNTMGIKTLWTCPETGGTVNIMSSGQDVAVFAGQRCNAVVFDEPFPAEIWAENWVRLIAKNGFAFIGATITVESKQLWMEELLSQDSVDGVPNAGIFNLESDQLVNLGYGLNQKSIDMMNVLSEEQRDVRSKGRSGSIGTNVLTLEPHHFLNKTIVDIPPNFIVDISIDYHPNKPQYIHFLATGPYNVQYLCHEIVSPANEACGPDWMGAEIVNAIKKFNLRLGKIIIDPLSKGNKNALEMEGETVFSRLSSYLAGFGYYLDVASKHKEEGIIQIKSKLQERQGPPSLYIYRDGCPIACKQLKRWKYDEKGVPLKEHDDSCENLYRLVNLCTSYEDPEPTVIVFKSQDRISLGANPTCGY